MQFEKQEYQEQCVKNIVDVLRDFDFKDPQPSILKDCLQSFYNDGGENLPSKDLSNKLNLDVLMETGTGKHLLTLKPYLNLIKNMNLINL